MVTTILISTILDLLTLCLHQATSYAFDQWRFDVRPQFPCVACILLVRRDGPILALLDRGKHQSPDIHA